MSKELAVVPNPLEVNDNADSDSRRKSKMFHTNPRQKTLQKRGCILRWLLSLRVILPSLTGSIIIVIVLVTVLTLLSNTFEAVDDVMHSLQEQVLTTIEARLDSEFGRFVTQTKMTAALIQKRGPLATKTLPRPQNLFPDYLEIAEIFDHVVTHNPQIKSQALSMPGDRMFAVSLGSWLLPGLPFNSLTWHAKGGEGEVWFYDVGKPASLNLSKPGDLKSEVGGETYPDPSAVEVGYAVWQIVSVVQLVTLNFGMALHDTNGTYVCQVTTTMDAMDLNNFVNPLRPTPNTKIFVVDSEGYIVMTTHGAILKPGAGSGQDSRILAKDAPDRVIAAASRAIGSMQTLRTQKRRYLTIPEEGKDWKVGMMSFTAHKAGLIIVVVTPEEEFLGGMREATKNVLVTVCLVSAGGFVTIIVISSIIAAVLHNLEVNMRSVSRMELDSAGTQQAHPTLIFTELKETYESYEALYSALVAFHHYVPMSVVVGVLKGVISSKLYMATKRLVISFQDIEDFTSLCEKAKGIPQLIIELVSPVLETMSNIITGEHGTIDKYIGDCIMSFWELGGTAANGNPRLTCLNAIRAMRRCLNTTAYSKELDMTVRFRSGVHMGECLLGNFGSTQRFNYTTIGDSVNTAARLEPLNKETKTRALASRDVIAELGSAHEHAPYVRYMGRYQLVGKEEDLGVYEIRAKEMSEQARAQWNDVMTRFEAGDFTWAANILRVQDEVALEEDPAAEEMRSLLQEYISYPPEGWTGTRRQRKK